MRENCYAVVKLMKKVSGSEPKMGGEASLDSVSIITSMTVVMRMIHALQRFSRRKQNISLYVMFGIMDNADR